MIPGPFKMKAGLFPAGYTFSPTFLLLWMHLTRKNNQAIPCPTPALACLVKWIWSFRWIWLFLLLKLKMRNFHLTYYQHVIVKNDMSVSQVHSGPLFRDMGDSILLSKYSLMFWKVKWRTHSLNRIQYYAFSRAIQNKWMNDINIWCQYNTWMPFVWRESYKCV